MFPLWSDQTTLVEEVAPLSHCLTLQLTVFDIVGVQLTAWLTESRPGPGRGLHPHTLPPPPPSLAAPSPTGGARLSHSYIVVLYMLVKPPPPPPPAAAEQRIPPRTEEVQSAGHCLILPRTPASLPLMSPTKYWIFTFQQHRPPHPSLHLVFSFKNYIKVKLDYVVSSLLHENLENLNK